jgi:hypothetical protein
MNSIKKLLGIAWLLTGPVIMAALIYRSVQEFAAARPEQLSELYVFWPVVLIIFLPIAVGFSIFGWYSVKGLYTHLPEHSMEVE